MHIRSRLISTLSVLILVRTFSRRRIARHDTAFRIVEAGYGRGRRAALSHAHRSLRDIAVVHHHARLVRRVLENDGAFLCNLLVDRLAIDSLCVIAGHGHRVRSEQAGDGDEE